MSRECVELMVTGLEWNLTVNVREEVLQDKNKQWLIFSLSLGVPLTELPFVDLGSSGKNLTGVDDGATPAISLPSRLKFGGSTETIAYVS